MGNESRQFRTLLAFRSLFRRGWISLAKIFGVFFISLVMSVAMISCKDSTTTTSSKPPQSHSPGEEVLSSVKLKYEWGKTGVDNARRVDFTIENQYDYDIKDIEIKCNYYAKNGTPIDSNTRTIYDVVKAKSKKGIKGFNMGFIHGQAHSSDCKITYFKII